MARNFQADVASKVALESRKATQTTNEPPTVPFRRQRQRRKTRFHPTQICFVGKAALAPTGAATGRCHDANAMMPKADSWLLPVLWHPSPKKWQDYFGERGQVIIGIENGYKQRLPNYNLRKPIIHFTKTDYPFN